VRFVEKGGDGLGGLRRSDAKRSAIHRNVFAHSNQRNPRINSEAKGIFQVNNRSHRHDWGQIASDLV